MLHIKQNICSWASYLGVQWTQTELETGRVDGVGM